MGNESRQQWLKRNRKPRVHITMDVETEGAKATRELPFIIGVLGDYTGDAPPESVKPLRDRKFTEISRDNFDKVLGELKPELSLTVKNELPPELVEDLKIEGVGDAISMQLKFSKMEDFDPEQLVEQVEPLKALLEARREQQELLRHVDRSPNLEGLIEKGFEDKRFDEIDSEDDES